MKKPAGANRRRHFRVQDQILIDYKIITDADLRGAMKHVQLVDPAELSVTTSLRRLELQLQNALTKLSHRHGELLHCIDILNSKINTIADNLELGGAQDEALQNRAVCDCSLSASGVAFTSREPLPLESKLRVRMVILPDYFHVTAYGEVVRVTAIEEPQDGFSHVIGVHFLHILDRYRDALARRSLQREIEDRRDKRLQRENGKLHPGAEQFEAM
jgi:hypothetical protein